MALTEQDKMFSPSYWCKRASPDEIISLHLKFIKEECDMNRKLIPCHLNIKYGPRSRENYDLYGSDLQDDAPIYIHIHGGYWQELDKHFSCYMVKPLYDNDYKVIIIGYDLCPDVTVPEIMTQIENAMTKILAYASRIGTKSISIGGHSAGAQLASSLYHTYIPSLPLNQRQLINQLYLISGIYDLTPLIPTYVNVKLGLDVATARQCSPQYRDVNDSGNAVFNVLVGEYDSPTFIEQSGSYYDKLVKLGVKSSFRILTDCDHFDIVEKMSQDSSEIVKMILTAKGNDAGTII